MSLTIQLPDELSDQLQDEARRRGIGPQELAVEILRDRLPAFEKAKALRSLLANGLRRTRRTILLKFRDGGRSGPKRRLDALRINPAFQYLPMTDAALARAASLWAEARNRGLATADPAELDCEVVLVAILLTSKLPQDQFVVATSNTGHLSRFLPAESWQNIKP